jgi:hypothetical protein
MARRIVQFKVTAKLCGSFAKRHGPRGEGLEPVDGEDWPHYCGLLADGAMHNGRVLVNVRVQRGHASGSDTCAYVFHGQATDLSLLTSPLQCRKDLQVQQESLSYVRVDSNHRANPRWAGSVILK